MAVASRSIVMLTADRQIDRRILLEADSLESAGWNVRIVGMPVGDAPDSDPRVIRVGSQGDAAPGKREAFVLRAYDLIRRLLPMNGRVMRTLKSLAWRYLIDQESFYATLFRPEVTRLSADVFVAHDLPMLPIGSEAAQRCGAKLVYDSHEFYSEQEFSRHEREKWRDIEARHIGACDAVMTVNPSIAAQLEQRYGVSGIHVVYNAERSTNAPVPNKVLRQTLGLQDDARILLFQGGLSSGRNIEELVASMAHVRNDKIHLVVLGNGALKGRLQRIVDAKRLEARVHFHAAVAQDRLLAWTAGADAGVIPYQATCLNNKYCTPNKLFEFIAAGLPILGSDLPEISRIISLNHIGNTTDLRTASAIAHAIDDFFSDDTRLSDWAINASVVRSSICWEVEGRKVVNIFAGLH